MTLATQSQMKAEVGLCTSEISMNVKSKCSFGF